MIFIIYCLFRPLLKVDPFEGFDVGLWLDFSASRLHGYAIRTTS